MAEGPYGPNYNLPFPSTFLQNNLLPVHQGKAFCNDFANNLAAQLQNQGIVARRHDMVFGAGTAAHAVVEYYDPNLKEWGVADSDYGVLYYDASRKPPMVTLNGIGAAMEQHAGGSIPHQFVTTASVSPDCPECFGDYWTANFSFDPALYYLNPLDIETGGAQDKLNDPRNYLVDSPNAGGVAGVYIFEFAHPTDQVLVQNGNTQELVTVQPPHAQGIDFGNFSDVFRLSSGWSYVGSPPAGLAIKRPACPVYPNPDCP
jgi:hypothetical protein